MTPLKLGILSAILIAAVATPLAIQRQAQARLREENESLRKQLGQIAVLTEQNDHLSNLVARATSDQAELAKQLKDLARLRGEASTLRRQTNEAAKLREENRKIQAAAAARKSPLEGITPLAKIDFTAEPPPPAGYASPEAAMQTMMWAHRNFDFKAIMESVTPEERKAMEKQLRETPDAEGKLKAKLAREFARIKAIHVLDKEIISENQILFHIYLEGPEQKLAARFRKIDGEWKFDNFDGN